MPIGVDRTPAQLADRSASRHEPSGPLGEAAGGGGAHPDPQFPGLGRCVVEGGLIEEQAVVILVDENQFFGDDDDRSVGVLGRDQQVADDEALGDRLDQLAQRLDRAVVADQSHQELGQGQHLLLLAAQ